MEDFHVFDLGHKMHPIVDVCSMTMSHFHPWVDNGGLSYEMIQDAIHCACEFLNMNDLEIAPAESTGVYL